VKGVFLPYHIEIVNYLLSKLDRQKPHYSGFDRQFVQRVEFIWQPSNCVGRAADQTLFRYQFGPDVMPIFALNAVMQPLTIWFLAAAVLTAILILILDGARGRVRRKTLRAHQSSILSLNQGLRGPTPDPAIGCTDDLPPPYESQFSGSGAAAPNGRDRTLRLGERKTMPSPRLVSLPVRGASDQIARSFVNWAQANGHVGEYVRHDVWRLMEQFTLQTGLIVASENAFFEALARVRGVERLYGRPARGVSGEKSLTTYCIYAEPELADFAGCGIGSSCNRRLSPVRRHGKVPPVLPHRAMLPG
jgi:hypothetical protein